MSDNAPRPNPVDLLTVLYVAVVFAGYSLLHEPVPGVNEPHYLCKARATWNPDYCPGDFFLTSKSAHSVFFYVVGYFTQHWSLEAVAVGGRIFSAVVLAWGWTALSAAFSLRRGSTVVAAAMLAAIALTGNLSGEWILGGFESKVPAWGLGVMGTARWLRITDDSPRRCWLKIGVLLGLSTAAHPVVGAWFVIAVSMSEMAQLYWPVGQWIQRSPSVTGPGSVVSSLTMMNGAALISSLPGVIPALRVLGSSDLSSGEQATANRIQVFMRLKHHLDPSEFPPSAWIHSTVLLAVIGYSSWRLMKNRASSVLRRHLLLLTAAITIAATGVAIGVHHGSVLGSPEWSWRAFLLKFYPFRLVDILLPVTAALTATIWLTQVMQDGASRTGTMIRRILPAVTAVVVLIVACSGRDDTPPGYSQNEYSAWKESCAWIRQTTPNDSLFVTPRESVAFKWFAERAEFVCYKDCPQDGGGILEWRQRLRDLGWMRPVQLQRPLKPSDLKWMQGHMQMTHLITRDHVVTGQDPIYENGVWRIYDVH